MNDSDRDGPSSIIAHLPSASEFSNELVTTTRSDPRVTRHLSEMDVAEICASRWRGHRIFDHQAQAWRVERNGIWLRDEVQDTFLDTQRICKSTGLIAFETLSKARAVEHLARSLPGIAANADQFDRDPFILGTPDGIVDLRSGKLLAPDPTRWTTMSTSVVPDECCPIPLWNNFMLEIAGGDTEQVRLLQQTFGYALTGDTREQKLFFLYGRGRNGKGVLTRTLAGILGSYAHRAQPETFTSGFYRHPTELASMRGKRMVYCSETEKGTRWAEGRIKDITGGDPLRARFMRMDEFEFQPQFKLIVSGNYEPQISGVDEAIRDRVVVIPFERVFAREKADRQLESKLRSEWPGIFAWAVGGCLDWQCSGLTLPSKVREATDAYFSRQDLFGEWIAQKCVIGADYRAKGECLFDSWKNFAHKNGEAPGNQKTFAEALARAGFGKSKVTSVKGKSARIYEGLKLDDQGQAT